jgi:predicted DNA-binding protein YlxM (UPF0122 family)
MHTNSGYGRGMTPERVAMIRKKLEGCSCYKRVLEFYSKKKNRNAVLKELKKEIDRGRRERGVQHRSLASANFWNVVYT